MQKTIKASKWKKEQAFKVALGRVNMSSLINFLVREQLPEWAKGGVVGPARDSLLPLPAVMGREARLSSSVSAAKKQKNPQNAWCLCWKSRSYSLTGRKGNSGLSLLQVVFFFFLNFSCRDFSIPKGRQERQLYFQNSDNAALSNRLNTKEVCWKFLIS